MQLQKCCGKLLIEKITKDEVKRKMQTNKTVATVERERERESYNLLKINSVLFGYILEKTNNKNINTHGLYCFEISK